MYHKYLIILIISVGYFQEIPNSFHNYKIKKLNTGVGNSWEENTIFGPFRFSKTNQSDSLAIYSRFGLMIEPNQEMLYWYGRFTFKEHFHGYLYPRIVSNPDEVEGYSGIPRDISRGGFVSGETDVSGISFENDWMIMQFGRGRQSWGAGNDIKLALSEESNSYDYGILGLDFGNLNVRYFHGYLETDSLSYNRYITGRGIEWNNGNSLLVGLSEIVIYSGKNRPIDFSYFNPISTHLEIELNNRQNNLGTASGNGVWQLSMDLLLLKKIRLSANYLFDEFTLDKDQTNAGKGHGRAHSFKLLYPLINNEIAIVSLYLSNISIGTNTLKHQTGYNNFVQRSKPLGWEIGSDSKELKLGLNSSYNNIIASLEIGLRNIGDNNIKNNPYLGYTNYLDELFPSGNVEKINFGSSKIQWWWKKNLSIFGQLYLYHSNFSGKSLELNLGIDVFFPVNTIL
tara:strand:+ start:809 stop:2173 length:1365 start_codon:yes stop_codon:yes gene_type:complete